MNKEKLHHLIDRYFEGLLTTEEERKLRKILMRQKGDDPEVNEALAVMLVSRPVNLVRSRKRRHPLLTAWSAAAGVVLLAAVGFSALHHSSSGSHHDMMVAYVGGIKVCDKDEIKSIIDNQLHDIRTASEFLSEEVEDDLIDIVEAFNDDEIWAEF